MRPFSFNAPGVGAALRLRHQSRHRNRRNELIQDAVQFDDDHGYEFYIARTHSSRAKEVFDDENGELYQRTLASLMPLPAKHALFYRFDYGDNWIFQIKPARGAASATVGGDVESGLIGESGSRPVQYPDGDE